MVVGHDYAHHAEGVTEHRHEPRHHAVPGRRNRAQDTLLALGGPNMPTPTPIAIIPGISSANEEVSLSLENSNSPAAVRTMPVTLNARVP